MKYISRTIGTGELQECGYVDVMFPTDVSYGSVRWDGTGKVTLDECEAALKWDISHGIKTQSQLESLIAFFRKMKGQRTCFKFKDWTTDTIYMAKFNQDRIGSQLDSYGSCRQCDEVIIVAVAIYEATAKLPKKES
ncbi:MAG: DUF2460 domain-containing protein [Candidatus Bathyarchaeia archaeon]